MIYALNVSGEADARYAQRSVTTPQRVCNLTGGRCWRSRLNERGDESARAWSRARSNARPKPTPPDAHWESQPSDAHYGYVEENDARSHCAFDEGAGADLAAKPAACPVRRAGWSQAVSYGDYWDSRPSETAFAIYGLIDYLKVSQSYSPTTRSKST